MSSSDEVAATATAVAGCHEKTSWPEVVGFCAKDAKTIILRDKPKATIDVLPVNAPLDKMFNPNRVRVFVNTVAEIPRVG